MANNPVAIVEHLSELIAPAARGRLLARGLARGLLWRDGVLPLGSPNFALTLTHDLLDFGYGVLALALELRDANRTREPGTAFPTSDAFRVAAEAIESAVRREQQLDRDRGRHLVVSATAFHLAGYAARSYSMLPIPALEANLSTQERCLALILRKDMAVLREQVTDWFSDGATRSDEVIAARLSDPEDAFDADDAMVLAATNVYLTAVGRADSGLLYGNNDLLQGALGLLRELITAAAGTGQLATWWVATLTIHLLEDLWDSSLHQRLPEVGPLAEQKESWKDLRSRFIAQMGVRRPPQMELWPSQLDAARRAIDLKDDLVIALPTSAGKTRIAELCILCTLTSQKRVVYVTPLRALSAQVERILARTFIPLGFSVTSLYGAAGATVADTQSLASANIVVATPEKLDFAMRQGPEVLDDIGLIVFDEGHMIGLGSRELRYEALVQKLLRRSDAHLRRIVCLSAMFNAEDPYFEDFTNWLRSDDPGQAVQVSWRPTRRRIASLDWSAQSESAQLNFRDEEEAYVPNFVKGRAAKGRRQKQFPSDDGEFHVATVDAFAGDGHSVLVYCPVRSQTESLAKSFLKAAKQEYLEYVRPLATADFEFAAAIGREWLGSSHPAYSALEAGIGIHHGALPRPFLSAIELLLHQRKLSVVIASPTLAQGLDLSCSVLIFRSLRRYEQGQWKCISTAEFSNVLGRVGRAFVDLDGIAVLPTFDAAKRARELKDYSDLIEASAGQQLVSGLARLVLSLLVRVSALLGVPPRNFSEYVLNNPNLWDDPRLKEEPDENEDEVDATTQRLSADLADLDVAILSTIDQLGADVAQVATLLDETLKGSLWRRTLNRSDALTQTIERDVLISRATWLWNRTSPQQRAAFYASGLGTEPGSFLNKHQEELIDSLAELHTGFLVGDATASGLAAVRFATIVLGHTFFGVRMLPANWQAALLQWISGVPSAEILEGRGGHDFNRMQIFLQDAIAFKLVWAAEAVRVQAIAMTHPRLAELGEGPALTFTYGVSNRPAALLCQMGLASRTAAIWAVEKTNARFDSNFGARIWLTRHEKLLAQRDFWSTEDQHLLWMRFAMREDIDSPRQWKRLQLSYDVKWTGVPLPPGAFARVLPKSDGTGLVCDADLYPRGRVAMPFDSAAWFTEAIVAYDGKLQLSLYGPEPQAMN